MTDYIKVNVDSAGIVRVFVRGPPDFIDNIHVKDSTGQTVPYYAVKSNSFALVWFKATSSGDYYISDDGYQSDTSFLSLLEDWSNGIDSSRWSVYNNIARYEVLDGIKGLYHLTESDKVQGVTIDPNGNIIVVLSGGNSEELKIYDCNGSLVKTIDLTQFYQNQQNHTGSPFADGNYIYLDLVYWDGTTATQMQVVKIDYDGNEIWRKNITVGNGADGIWIKDNYIYITDYVDGKIRKFNLDDQEYSTPVEEITTPTHPQGGMIAPDGIYIYGFNGQNNGDGVAVYDGTQWKWIYMYPWLAAEAVSGTPVGNGITVTHHYDSSITIIGEQSKVLVLDAQSTQGARRGLETEIPISGGFIVEAMFMYYLTGINNDAYSNNAPGIMLVDANGQGYEFGITGSTSSDSISAEINKYTDPTTATNIITDPITNILSFPTKLKIFMPLIRVKYDGNGNYTFEIIVNGEVKYSTTITDTTYTPSKLILSLWRDNTIYGTVLVYPYQSDPTVTTTTLQQPTCTVGTYNNGSNGGSETQPPSQSVGSMLFRPSSFAKTPSPYEKLVTFNNGSVSYMLITSGSSDDYDIPIPQFNNVYPLLAMLFGEFNGSSGIGLGYYTTSGADEVIRFPKPDAGTYYVVLLGRQGSFNYHGTDLHYYVFSLTVDSSGGYSVEYVNGVPLMGLVYNGVEYKVPPDIMWLIIDLSSINIYVYSDTSIAFNEVKNGIKGLFNSLKPVDAYRIINVLQFITDDIGYLTNRKVDIKPFVNTLTTVLTMKRLIFLVYKLKTLREVFK